MQKTKGDLITEEQFDSQYRLATDADFRYDLNFYTKNREGDKVYAELQVRGKTLAQKARVFEDMVARGATYVKK